MRHLVKGPVTAVVVAGSLAIVLSNAWAASTPATLTATSVGSLRVDHARAQDIVRFGGTPRTKSRYEIQYHCSSKTKTCAITYLLATGGPHNGRLVAAILGAGPFRTANGVTVGMTEARARALARHAVLTTMCGFPVLRVAPSHAGAQNPNSGLEIGISKNTGRVNGFTVLSSRVTITCIGKGFVRYNN
jgi:hypothetical protein